MSLPILNVDAFIVQQNIERELRADEDSDAVELDTEYFTNLSDDAVPELVSALQAPTTPDSVKRKVAASLACIRYDRVDTNPEVTWYWFHYARFTADKALASVDKTLDGYKVDQSDWDIYVITPDGQSMPCSAYYYD